MADSITFYGKQQITIDTDDIPEYIQGNNEIATQWENEIGGSYCRLCLSELPEVHITCACSGVYCHSCSSLLGYTMDETVLDIETCDMCAIEDEEAEDEEAEDDPEDIEDEEAEDEVESQLVEQALEESLEQ